MRPTDVTAFPPKSSPHRKDAALRQTDTRERRTGFNQDRCPDHPDTFAERTQRFEVLRRLGLRQMIR